MFLPDRLAGRRVEGCDLAEAAAKLPVPADVTLKDPAKFTLIGTDVPKLDSKAKSTGQAVFTMDATRPGMLTVLIARPPLFGAVVKSVDDTAAIVALLQRRFPETTNRSQRPNNRRSGSP